MPHDLASALQHAIDMEIHIRDFYIENQAKVSTKLAREALQFLADQESKHIEDIIAFQQSLASAQAFDLPTRSAASTKNNAKKFFGRQRQLFEQTIAPAPDDAKIYRLGLQIEENGYKFYAEQAEHAEDEQAKGLFTFLKHEEIAHYELLEKLSNYLENPGTWFLEEEKWLFEG
jgi:rubrerythrin